MGIAFGSFGFQSSSSGGSPTNLTYVHTQSTPALIWYVQHNLNARCAVQIVDEAENEIVSDIKWIDDNNVEITFNTPKTGFAYCNK